jgi:flagellar assembly protein FliH
MGASAKFTFDTEFRPEGDVVSSAARARQKKTLTNAELDTMRSSAVAEGLTSGQVRAAESLASQVEAVAVAITAALDASHAEIENVRAEATALAFAAAKKIAPAALAALPAGDVENALRQAMHQAIGEPRLNLRASPAVAEALAARLDEIAHQEGYDGRVSVSADPAFAGADCRIDWRGGGSERREATIEAALDALIANRFSTFVPSVKG